jgi:hypothetical protein
MQIFCLDIRPLRGRGRQKEEVKRILIFTLKELLPVPFTSRNFR